MARRILILAAFAIAAFSANVKLYLKDGTWHVVREYQILQDRVRFYSTERRDWEEIPKELVDLDRTKKEAAEREASEKEALKAEAEEEKAERDARREVARIPQEPGVYWINGAELTPLKLGESKVVSDRKRTILRILTPVPIVPGKGTLELDGESAALRIADNRPQFYFRLSKQQQFGLVKMWPAKNARIVEKLTIESVSKMIFEEQQPVETFKQQVADGLYKIWPEQPIENGEYALVEFTPAEDSQINIQVYDFGIGPAKSVPAATPASKKDSRKKK